MSRERVDGFLHACMMIGYRVHTKDSPLRAAQGRPPPPSCVYMGQEG